MIYVATVKHYEEWNNKETTSYMFVCADSTVKAVEQISNYYGEECLEDITLAPFSPDNFLEFDNSLHDRDLFEAIKETLNDRIVW